MIIQRQCRADGEVVMEEEGAAEEQTIININNFQQLNQLYNAIIITSTTITIPTTPPAGGEMKRSGRNQVGKELK